MRLRTLKKWSKVAAPILEKHYGEKVFLAVRGENYHGLIISCKCPRRPHQIQHYKCECQWHPLKNTPMVGRMSGYYEPEWDERTAFSELREYVLWGERPKAVTDAEWAIIMKAARVTAADVARHEAALARYIEAATREGTSNA